MAPLAHASQRVFIIEIGSPIAVLCKNALFSSGALVLKHHCRCHFTSSRAALSQSGVVGLRGTCGADASGLNKWVDSMHSTVLEQLWLGRHLPCHNWRFVLQAIREEVKSVLLWCPSLMLVGGVQLRMAGRGRSPPVFSRSWRFPCTACGFA